mmetsp:Transcript_23223/g.65785  ORF Transcript_23223/g.65785 Transcript_23223/m.65785 type:complete len:205 (+) Transcript_23223:194-808(+)
MSLLPSSPDETDDDDDDRAINVVLNVAPPLYGPNNSRSSRFRRRRNVTFNIPRAVRSKTSCIVAIDNNSFVERRRLRPIFARLILALISCFSKPMRCNNFIRCCAGNFISVVVLGFVATRADSYSSMVHFNDTLYSQSADNGTPFDTDGLSPGHVAYSRNSSVVNWTFVVFVVGVVDASFVVAVTPLEGTDLESSVVLSSDGAG